MCLYNSLITKLRAPSLIVQSCLRGRRVYEWEVRSGKMWCRTWWEFVSTAQNSSSVSSTRCDTEGSTALHRFSLTPRRRCCKLDKNFTPSYQRWTSALCANVWFCLELLFMMFSTTIQGFADTEFEEQRRQCSRCVYKSLSRKYRPDHMLDVVQVESAISWNGFNSWVPDQDNPVVFTCPVHALPSQFSTVCRTPKGKGAYSTWYSASSYWITSAEAFRYGGIRVLKGFHSFTCTPTRRHPQSEWAIPPFAFPAIAGTHLPTPEGWKAE